ncbi:phoenix [Centropristis striata]|uniref:phoenix n=1 Tax=Centropristis striata TaxID=184440 RepID=UPI0027E06370|nr:phoenix [Centropristis striata]
MTGVHNSLTGTQSAVESQSESRHIVLDASPPDYVQKISRNLESSVGHDKVSNTPAEEDSDSGDSLFITQKPVPEAVRSKRRRPYSLSSKSASPIALEESEYESENDSLNSAPHGESKTTKERRRKTYTVPKYHFPFLADRKCKRRRTLPVQNSSLHKYVMGGFFKCVKELWQGYGREDMKPSLPTVDTDEENISPLSEEDEERSEGEDIRVVERKCFLAPSRAKSQPTWGNQVTQQRIKKASNAKEETPQGKQTKTLYKGPVNASKLKDKPMSSSKDGHATSDRNVQARTETTKTNKQINLLLQKAVEEELCNDNDAAVCEPGKLQTKESTQRGTEASTTLTETQADVVHTDDLVQTGQTGNVPARKYFLHSLPDLLSDTDDDGVCNETVVEKKKDKDHESVEEGKGQSQKEQEAATSVNVEVEETPTFSEDKGVEPPALQTSDELGFNDKKWTESSSLDDKPLVRQEETHTAGSKQKKKKRKKNKSETEDVGEEVDGNLESDVRVEDSLLSVSLNMEECGKKTQTDVVHADDFVQTGQTGDVPARKYFTQSLPDLLSDTDDDGVCNETVVEKKKDKDHESVEEEKGQSQKEQEAATSVNVEVEETQTFSEDNGMEPPAVQTSDELGFNDKKGMENLSLDNNKTKEKKKKRKKNKSETEDVGEEVNRNLESDVRVEDSLLAVSLNVEECGKGEEKEKKRKESGGDVEQLQSDYAEMQKKKRKKEEEIVIGGNCEKDQATNGTLDLTSVSVEQLAESGNCLENTAASQDSFESSHVKRKKHKKKRQSSSVDDAQEGVENVDVEFCLDGSVTMAKGSGTSRKKKKKKKNTIFEGVDASSVPEENEKVENRDHTQITKEDLEDQNAEPVSKKKKKKKKMSDIFSTNVSEDKETQNDDSVSVREREKKRSSSFLVADAKEKDAETHGEQIRPLQPYVWGAEKHGVSTGDLKELKDGVTKKKKKRKMSVAQDSMENDCAQDLEEPNKTCQRASPEKTTDTGLKRKKKRKGNESVSKTPMERVESAADVGLSPTDEPVVLKKKKKRSKDKPCDVIQEGLSTATEESTLNTFGSVSHKKKGKHGRSAEICKDSSTSELGTVDNMVEHASVSLNTLENQELYDKRDKKKKKKKSTDDVLLDGNSITKSAELELKENKKGKKQSADPGTTFSSPISETSPSKIKMSSSEKNKHKKVKRRLHNRSEDFLLEC